MTKTGIELIAEERQRQIEQEGWTAEHDAQHYYGELAIAAACYAVESGGADNVKVVRCDDECECPDAWPWNLEADKRSKHDYRRRLQFAGALIAAELDRLQAQVAEWPPACTPPA